MWQKWIAITRKDLYTAFQDRQAMLTMFAAPIALSVIIGLAFGTGGDIVIDAVPLGIANQDTGTALDGDPPVTLGDAYTEAFIPPDARDADGAAGTSPVSGEGENGDDFSIVYDLTDADSYDDPAVARAAVEDGDLAAALTIPADFSAAIFGEPGQSSVDVFYDSGLSVGPSIVLSIARQVTNGINTVILAQRMGPPAVTELGAGTGADTATIEAAAAQVGAQAMTVATAQPVTLREVDLQGDTRTVDAMQYFAPSMAILFMTFAMATGATSILDEQRRWTMQRILSTATPRWVFMGGKLGGTYLTGVVQMAVLIIATGGIALLMGREGWLWGDNVVGIALLVVAVVFAATSLGLVIAALAESTEQASTYSTVVLFILGMLGGSFIQVDALPEAIGWLPKLTLNYWGIQGFFDLAYDRASVADILPNVGLLLLMGVVFFAVSLWRFNRRLDI